jgi:hypothetical protein
VASPLLDFFIEFPKMWAPSSTNLKPKRKHNGGISRKCAEKTTPHAGGPSRQRWVMFVSVPATAGVQSALAQHTTQLAGRVTADAPWATSGCSPACPAARARRRKQARPNSLQPRRNHQSP